MGLKKPTQRQLPMYRRTLKFWRVRKTALTRQLHSPEAGIPAIPMIVYYR